MRILIVSRSYPAPGDLYQYPFVHRRVLAYRAAGHSVRVFRPNPGASQPHEFEGVTCHSGGVGELRSMVAEWSPDAIAAHGFSEAMWPFLRETGRIPVIAWLHGSEIPGFFRARAAEIPDSLSRTSALGEVAVRRDFWQALLSDFPPQLRLVFVSQSAVELMRDDCGASLKRHMYEVISNPIDTSLFAYRPKTSDQRLSILSIRPFDCRTRANDLSVSAVLRLSKKPGFDRLRFTFIGDGPLFDQTLAPLASFANVTLRRGFLTQAEIVREHNQNGIFLVPTRLDTHGVSRDEAMASGLVPVTNAIPVVREFVSDETAGLAAPEDADGLADEIWRMIEQPDLFLARSAQAADLIRSKRTDEKIVSAELDLLREAAAYV